MEVAAITLHIDTDHGPTTSNVIPPAISIHKDQRRYIVNNARRPTAAEHCRHLAEFAGNFPVVVELDHLFHDDVHAAVGGGFRENPDLDHPKSRRAIPRVLAW
jgi:hypothetical protein